MSRKTPRPSRLSRLARGAHPAATAAPDRATRIPLLPLGALAAGFGLAGSAFAQATAPAAPAPATAQTPAAPAPETVLPAVRASARAEPSGKDSLQTHTTSIAKGKQDIRDVPQSMTVITERLIDDRNLDTLKEALRTVGGISFQAAEGAEEDIRLRGFSLQASGDIFVDGLRDPAFYERDSFNWDRLEILRGSASMLFGRGSTGGVVNQVSKTPRLLTQSEVAATMSTDGSLRGTVDFNLMTDTDAALRINALVAGGGDGGAAVDKKGIAPTYRWGIGTRDEFLVGLYYLDNDNGINYGVPYLVVPGSTKRALWPTDPDNYYGMGSDYSGSSVTLGTAGWIHRFDDRSEVKTVLRLGEYERDMRASAVRFAGATQQPGGVPVSISTFSDDTVLTRGSNNKVQDMRTAYLQSDYSGRLQAWGMRHDILAGIDGASEDFRNYAQSLPPGVTLPKPPTKVGTPDDNAWIDESRRINNVNRSFDAKSGGLYAQDLVEFAPGWKALGGVRFDSFKGTYNNVASPGNNVCSTPVSAKVERSDSLWSGRFGGLYQPTPYSSYHLSYGTSYNTAGDTYQYDAGNAYVDPEKSRNIELGAKLEFAEGKLSTRFALFHATKYNERNRDSETVNACNYVLSGKRHAAGIDMDVAGRITPDWEVFVSYSWIPIAEIDASSTPSQVGTRPGLTPRHSGSIWTTYRVAQKFRVGAGLNGASEDIPEAPPQFFTVPGWTSVDVMGEYTWEGLTLRLYLANLADKHYAGSIYRGHYVPGQGRTLSFTVAQQF